MLNLSNEFIEKLQEQIQAGKDQEILSVIGDLHPADIAEVFDELRGEETAFVYKLLNKELAADVLVELEEDVREHLLAS